MQNNLQFAESQPTSGERKQREVSRYAFPYYDLNTCIEVTKDLHDRAGGKASLIQLASYLGHKDEFSGAYRSKIWGAKLFGLVNIAGNNISTTPLGEQLGSATVGIQRDRRLAEAFLNIPLFREVYRRYENTTLPSAREGLKKALHDTFGVSSKRVSLALKSLERSAEQAGFKREGPNRLIHPVPIGLVEKDAAAELRDEEPEELGTEGVGVGLAKSPRREAITEGTHPAIVGFLQELPVGEDLWTESEQQRWIEAFIAMVKALYPTANRE